MDWYGLAIKQNEQLNLDSDTIHVLTASENSTAEAVFKHPNKDGNMLLLPIEICCMYLAHCGMCKVGKNHIARNSRMNSTGTI